MAILNSCNDLDDLGQGQYRQTISVKPRYYMSNGTWKNLTYNLGNSGDANLSVGVSELFDFRIMPVLAGRSPLVYIGKGASSIRYTPLNTNSGIQGIVLNNSITFPNAWNNADLVITNGGNFIKKDIKLKTGHPAQFQFRIDDNTGLDSNLSSNDFYLANPYLWKDNRSEIPLTWTKTIQANKTILTVTLPNGDWNGWTLDPTFVAQPDPTVGIDTYIDYNAPNTNDGNMIQLLISNAQYQGTTTWGAAITNYVKYNSLILFNFSSIPSNSIISSSTLDLYVSTSFNNYTINAYRMLRPWVETEATWNRATTAVTWTTPGADGIGTDRESVIIGSIVPNIASLSISLTPSYIQAMLPGGSFTNNGFMLKKDLLLNSGQNSTGVYSSDYTTNVTLRPKITIVYSAGSTSVSKYFMNYMTRRVNK